MKKLSFIIFVLTGLIFSNQYNYKRLEALRHISYGIRYLKIKNEHGNAINQFKKALSIYSNLPEAHYNLGRVYKTIGEIDHAIEEFNKSLKKLESLKSPVNISEIYIQLGESFELKENYNQAIYYYEKAYQNMPLKKEFFAKLGALYFKTGDLIKAEKNLLNAIKYAPLGLESYYYLIELYIKTNQILKAKKLLKTLLEIDPQNEIGKKWQKKLKS